MKPRQSPCPHRHEDRQRHRKLLGQHAHAQGQGRQHATDPIVLAHTPPQHHQQHGSRCQRPEGSHQRSHLLLQGRGQGLDVGQGLTDAAHARVRADGHHLRHPMARHHQRAGPHPVGAGHRTGPWRVLRLIRWCSPFVHRPRFTRQQGFVHPQAGGPAHDGIGGHTVALAEHHPIAAHHLAGAALAPLAITVHPHHRHSHVAQRPQGMLPPAALHHHQGHREQGKSAEQQAFAPITQHEVQACRCQQQHEHRLGEHFLQGVPPPVAFCIGQGVGAVRTQAAAGFGAAQATQGFLMHRTKRAPANR